MMTRKTSMLFLILLSCAYMAFAQDRTITGRIIDETSKQPVVGATVTVRGARKTVTAGADGSFTITVTQPSVTLIISSIGFASKEVTATAGTPVEVSLSTDSRQLGEVVVTALGIVQQKKSLAYATQTVPINQITEVRPTDNFMSSLNGKVANLIVTQGSGGLGSGTSIILRGNRDINGDNNALIVVDGVPWLNTTFSTAGNDFGSLQTSDGASELNPDDIESMTILRGATAAALYGTQAGNGAIIISTKKGHKGRFDVFVNSGIGFEKAWALPQFQDQYGQGNSGLIATDSSQSGASWGAKMQGQSYVDYLYKQNTYTAQPNNIKDFFHTGMSLNNSVGFSAGGDHTQTYFSYTNNYAKGIIPNNDLNRHTLDFRISGDVFPKLTYDVKATYINQTINGKPRTGEENSPVFDAYQMPRSEKLSDAKNYQSVNNVGIYGPTNWPSTLNSIYQNPYWMLNNTFISEDRQRVVGYASLKYAVTPWLSIRGSVNLDRTDDELDQQYQQGTLLWNTNAGGSFATTGLISEQRWFDLSADGHNNLAKDLKIDYQVGTIRQDVTFNEKDAGSNGLNVTNKFSLNFASNPAIGQSGSESLVEAVYGHAKLGWKNAIFLDGTLREDWASPLPKPYRYSYPSVGLSAVISDLVTLPEPISFLKVNGTFAEVGNPGTPYLLQSTLSYDQGAGNGSIQRSSTYPIPNLQPEKVKNYEGGFEINFLHDRIGFAADYYHSNTYNQLLQIPLPVATGYSNQYINAGNIENHGLEFTVTARPIKNKDFTWELSGNFSLNRNKVISLSPNLSIVDLGGADQRSAQPEVRVGGSFGDLYSYVWLKNSKNQYELQGSSSSTPGAPLTTYITGDTLNKIGNYNPRELVGLTNTFTYHRFSFRFLVDGRIGGTMVSGTEMNLSFSGITKNTLPFREGGLTLPGVDVNGNAVPTAITAQSFWQTASGQRYGVGQFFAYNATSFRLRELSLGYDIPLKNTTILKSLKFSAVARNLFWLYRGKSTLNIPGIGTRKMWFDPDVANGNGVFQGVEYGAIPSTRTWGFNLKANF
jgi:TonB-linked SusC/RagA family outer membrane protein